MASCLMDNSSVFSPSVSHFLSECGLSNFEVSLLNKGGNNKAYKVVSSEGTYVLKAYFTSEQDQRSRLRNEYTFSQFCWENQICSVPQPFFADYDKHLGLYEYIHGEKLKTDEIKESHIQECINFTKAINHHKTSNQGRSLPVGSEASFCLKEHLETVEKRIKRLESIDENLSIDKEAKKFVVKSLFPTWQEIKQNFTRNCQKLNFDLDVPISQNDRILSPSDFGFHNALGVTIDSSLARTSSKIKFIDFEYAGWDDPAKLVCDFFNQVAIPVPNEFYTYFNQEIADLTDNPAYHQKRTDLLMSIYSIKWISIILNDFLPQNRFRLDFLEHNDINDHKTKQLHKAERGLQKLILELSPTT